MKNRTFHIPGLCICYRLLLLSAITMLHSCSSRTDTLFESLSSSQTSIGFENKLVDRPHLNILYYLYYYNGGGVSAGDVNNDGLTDLYFTANSKGNNKLYLNKGNFQFEDITSKAGVQGDADWCSGITMADVNGDGFLDIYVSTVSGDFELNGHNLLYINNGNPSAPAFTEQSARYGLNFSGLSTQAAFFDYDHDGDLDCYLLNHSKQPHANVVDTSNRRRYSAQSGDVLFRNDVSTSGKFTDVSAQSGIYQSNLGYGLGLAVADFNNDGWEDIYVGNDFHENDYYYLNNGKGGFNESGAQHFRHYSRFSMGNDAADYNNDGQMDLVTVDMLPPDEKVLKTYGSDENPDIYKVKLEMNGYQQQYSRNCLQKNNGRGSSYSEVGLLAGISATDWSWSPLFADFDNDGIKDLFIASGIVKRPVDLDYIRFVSDMQIRKGMDQTDQYDAEVLKEMPGGETHPFLFKGNGESFTPADEAWGTANMKGCFTGAAYADLDNDGDLDLVINPINAKAVVLKNNAAKRNQLTLSFMGQSGNTKGLGAKAWVFQQGKFQYQQLMATRGFQSSSELRLHFGLGDKSKADSILIVWPDQRYQVIRNPSVNTELKIDQKNASGRFVYEQFFSSPAEMLEPVTTGISWRHKEDPFVDYNVQYLIPHGLSTRGPKIAVADVNSDGLDDVYFCGAHGQPGSLQWQQPDGSFRSVDSSLFATDAASEDVDALFFDANSDGKPDLYVVSGGNVLTGNAAPLLDRLYLNDGSGHFLKTNGALPQLYANKSCAAAADVDGDKDLDLFVGVLADAHAYGVPQTSYLLLNDGKGRFSAATSSTIRLDGLGMVTSVAFTDVNNDRWPDLIVGGEWMPLTMFINKNGAFQQNSIPASTGWWQTIFTDDVDGDGNIDILAGNWGCNTKFWSGKNGPVKLYVSDFDRNGKTDQLLSYTAGGKEYPFLAKDEMERALPVLKKHYLKYGEYAGLEMKDAFYGFAEQVQPLEAQKMESVVCYGDGKGGFTLAALPFDLQQAPVFSFQKISSSAEGNTYICGGNFFNTIPYEGRYDAQPAALFRISRTKKVTPLLQPGLAALSGEVRDLKWIKTGRGAQLAAARNNESPVFYRVKE